MTVLTIKEAFERDGYVSGLPVLSESETLRYRTAYDRLEAEAAARGITARITNRHHEDPAIWALATHPRVLEYAREILGPDVVLLSSGFFVKQPGASDKFVAWHQDTTYWGLNPPFAITVWVAIDDSDVENACMRVIPGSHKVGLLPHRKSGREGNLLGQDQEIESSLFDESSAVDFILKAGHASIHHGELIHGSNANCSNRRRCGMTIRFTTPIVKPVLDGPNPFRDKPILVCGEDRFGHFIYAPRPAHA